MVLHHAATGHQPLPRRTPTGRPLHALRKLPLAYPDVRISSKMATWQTSRPSLPDNLYLLQRSKLWERYQ